MFDIFLYPVSAVLWFWHKVFGALLGSDSGPAWVLAVVFLVFTIRAMLVGPALRQLRAAQHARQLAPQIQKIRQRYRHDRARMAREIQKVHADRGISPLAGVPLMLLAALATFLSIRVAVPGAHRRAAVLPRQQSMDVGPAAHPA